MNHASPSLSEWRLRVLFSLTGVQTHNCSCQQAPMAYVKLTWLVLGEDPAARSHRVEQFTAL